MSQRRLERIAEVIREVRMTDEVQPTDRLSDLNFDSLARVELAIELEDAFGLDIEAGVEQQWDTVDDVDRYLEQRGVE